MSTAVDDAFDASQPDGRVRLTINGVKYVLKRPRMKEFRKLRETLMDITRRAGATPEEAELASRGKVDISEIVEREDELLSWWSEVFGMLEEKDQALPPEDELPPWLIGPVVAETINAWLLRPARPGA